MRYEITLPVGAQTAGRIIVGRWRKEIGDNIRKSEVVLTVETSTMFLEIESEVEGMLGDILRDTGDEVSPGEALGIIEDEKPETEAGVAASVTSVEAPAEEAANVQAATQEMPAVETKGPVISARARWLAEAAGVDMNALHGSGPGGRVIVSDVEAVIATHKSEPFPVIEEKATAAPSSKESTKQIRLTAMEQVLAQRMAQAHRDTPQYNITIVADATNLVAWRKGQLDPPSITAILIKMCAEALQDHPRLYATFLGRSWRQNNSVNMAVTVDTPHGMTWPVLRDVQKMSVAQVGEQLFALVNRARQNKLTALDTADANFTLSNLGMLGIEHFNAIINPGQASALAVGAVHPMPCVVGGGIEVRQMGHLTLGCDRRIIEGITGAQFLAHLKQLIEKANL